MTSSLRTIALDLFDAAIQAADPGAALGRYFSQTPIRAPNGTLYVIAIGKAACPMMRTTLDHVPASARVAALAVTNSENMAAISGATVLEAGHPVPDHNGAAAARAVIDLLGKTTRDDRVIALMSGGGSALLPAPVDGVSLEDKAALGRVLLGSGFDITRMNTVRQQVSHLKGGGFLRHAAPASVEAFILSDVVGDDLRIIASGPTVAPAGRRTDAHKLLVDHGLLAQIPVSIRTYLSQPEPAQRPLPQATNRLICSNRRSLEAMLAALPDGLSGAIVDDRLEGNVAQIAPRLISLFSQPGPHALIFGGETTVTLTGSGLGGRNQDLALRIARQSAALTGDWVFLSGGTDGRDGPTDAAGGLVDAGTLERIKAAGLDPAALLANNDSHTALKAAGDLIMTGGTGTNVADVQVFLRR